MSLAAQLIKAAGNCRIEKAPAFGPYQNRKGIHEIRGSRGPDVANWGQSGKSAGQELLSRKKIDGRKICRVVHFSLSILHPTFTRHLVLTLWQIPPLRPRRLETYIPTLTLVYFTRRNPNSRNQTGNRNGIGSQQNSSESRRHWTSPHR